MALVKNTINVNFAGGLDQKSDPFQVPVGKFLNLQNTIFTKGGLLQKRNGFAQLPALPDNSSQYLTTFNGNLTAIGTSLEALSAGSNTWVNKGNILLPQLTVQPVARSSFNQTQADCAVSANNLVCVVYTEINNGTSSFKYVITDYTTGQNIVNPTTIVATGGYTTNEAPRVFLLGNYFIILFAANNGGAHSLQYISIRTNFPNNPNSASIISTSYVPSLLTETAFDGVVAVNGSLYLAWNDSNGGPGGVNTAYLTPTLTLSPKVIIASAKIADSINICSDDSNMAAPILWVSFYDSAATKAYVIASTASLTSVLAATEIATGVSVTNITASAQNAAVTVFYEITNSYGYDSAIPTNYIKSVPVTQAGSVGSTIITARSAGLASKSFIFDSKIYYLAAYFSLFQPTYFLMQYNSTTALSSVVVKLAYSNGGGYVTTALPGVTFDPENNAHIAYLFKDLITSVNKTQGIANAAGIYSQTGVNMVTLNLSTSAPIVSSEIGNNLHLSGGFLWSYDGNLPVEQNFHVWPDNVETTPAASGGGMLNQEYFYQAIYQWTDGQGNIFYSAPSVPVSATVGVGSGLTFTSVFTSGVSSITVSSASNLFVGQIITDNTTAGNITPGTYITSISGTTIGLSQPTAGASAVSPGDTLQTTQQGEVTVNIPTLRLTYKPANSVKIVLYRWSTAQQNYYQVTSITAPLLSDSTVDYVSYIDKQADYAIQGNGLIYTTGGVVEDIAPPATSLMALYKSRLFLVDSEDRNLLWYSKQVIENTPVEMSDLFTIFIAPTISAQGNTGPITALSAMDDKLIIFKKNAIYYIVGTGPDNTGASNDFSDPIYISGTVGCTNQNSIVLTPNGLMFQSDKGIWLLGRDLSSVYIGAAVENFNSSIVTSALTIPGTNQVRFGLSTGEVLMFDYFYSQWGTFAGIPSVSATLYQSLHTFINSAGEAYQESTGQYLDGSDPVLIKFVTSWFNLAGLQGYIRAYYFYLLGTYISPHKLTMQIAYDYNPSPTQSSVVTPTNFSGTWGSEQLWGSGASWGGYANLEQERIFLQQQKCQAFQITLIESFDNTIGAPAGAGFTMSGIDLVIGGKDQKPRLKPQQSYG